jgi:hypothetical protein
MIESPLVTALAAATLLTSRLCLLSRGPRKCGGPEIQVVNGRPASGQSPSIPETSMLLQDIFPPLMGSAITTYR